MILAKGEEEFWLQQAWNESMANLGLWSLVGNSQVMWATLIVVVILGISLGARRRS